MQIKHPDAAHTGSVYVGPTILDFRDGVAELRVPLPKRTADDLAEQGYKIGDAAGPDDDFVDLERLTIAQLKDYAEAHGIDLGEASKKAEIVEAISLAPFPEVVED